MKPVFLPLADFVTTAHQILKAGFVATLLAVPTLSHGDIVANFSGGGSSSSPVTDHYDAWTGMAGGGWSTAWELRNNYSGSGTGAPTFEVISTPSTLWSGPRLQVTPVETRQKWSIGRSYDFDSLGSSQISISFQISIDDLGTFLSTPTNSLFIGENNTNTGNLTTSTSWFLAAFGGSNPNGNVSTSSNYRGAKQAQWNVGIGGSDAYVPTGILLQEDTLYTFTLTLDSASYTYTLTLTDGTNTFTSGLLTFRSENPLGRTLVFAEDTEMGQNLGFSLGNIVIAPVPEVSSSLLMLTGVTALLVRRQHKPVTR